VSRKSHLTSHFTFQTDEQASDSSERQVTEPEDQGVDFQEAERRYAEIKRRHDAGSLTNEEFDEQLKQLMVQDQEGLWWVKSRATGDWYKHDGTAWIKDTPPGYEPLQAASQVTSPPRGGQSTTPARDPTSPRTIRLWWFVPVALIGSVIIVVAIARNTGGNSDHAGGGGSATPTPTSSDLPFSAHFSHTSSAWDQQRGKNGGSYNDEGGYRIYSPASASFAVVPRLEGGPYQDVAVEVDAKVLNNQADHTSFGVVCRKQDGGDYYGLLVFGNGDVKIVKWRKRDGIFRTIAGKDRSEVIGGNVVSPHIQGDCVGNTLILYVDDQKVIEVEDSAFRSGDVGLLVGSGDPTVGADILFDNFTVKKP
jgi:hypothetical protein